MTSSPSPSTDLTTSTTSTNSPFPLTATDLQVLSTPDSEFHLLTWSDLRTIISSNALEALKRRPSDLHKYLAWSHEIKSQYGGIVPYVIRERLRWSPVVHQQLEGEGQTAAPRFQHYSKIPFQDQRDYAILVNDWPYGFVEGIRHLVVWSKTPIATEDVQRGGDLTEESRRVIEEFVERAFVRGLEEEGGEGEGGKEGEDSARDRVLWFKNWVSLQSVRGVDHVHVLVKDVSDEMIAKWTRRKDL